MPKLPNMICEAGRYVGHDVLKTPAKWVSSGAPNVRSLLVKSSDLCAWTPNVGELVGLPVGPASSTRRRSAESASVEPHDRECGSKTNAADRIRRGRA